VPQHETFEERQHERIRAAGDEALDPAAKAAVNEVRAGQLVFAEDDEEDPDANPQERQRAIVSRAHGQRN
jgi:hypothetical protein